MTSVVTVFIFLVCLGVAGFQGKVRRFKKMDENGLARRWKEATKPGSFHGMGKDGAEVRGFPVHMGCVSSSLGRCTFVRFSSSISSQVYQTDCGANPFSYLHVRTVGDVLTYFCRCLLLCFCVDSFPADCLFVTGNGWNHTAPVIICGCMVA